MITSQNTTPESLTLSRATSGHGYQQVTATGTPDGAAVRVKTRLDGRHGDGWAEAILSVDDLKALRDWIDQVAAEHRLPQG